MKLSKKMWWIVTGVALTMGTGAGAASYALTTSAANAAPARTPPAQPPGFGANGRIAPGTCLHVYSATQASHLLHDASGKAVCATLGPPPMPGH